MPEDGITQLTIGLSSGECRITVGHEILGKIAEIFMDLCLACSRGALVTDPIVQSLYGATVAQNLQPFFDVRTIVVPAGEKAKSWETVSTLHEQFIEHEMDRESVVLSLGGGTVSDVAGFAASTFLRGVRLMNIPTTLLSQVDSSIGGKTAVNHPKGKNLIGTFHQPLLVFTDTGALNSLPQRELVSGLAEAVKYGVIADSQLFSFLKRNVSEILDRDAAHLHQIVTRCCAIKAGVVEKDEFDINGERATLNLGHTIGHALETLFNFSYTHGEAVAMGLVAAAKISREMDIMSGEDADKIEDLVTELGLPTSFEVRKEELTRVMHRDKKSKKRRIVFVLPTAIGSKPVLRALEDELIARLLEEQGYVF